MQIFLNKRRRSTAPWTRLGGQNQTNPSLRYPDDVDELVGCHIAQETRVYYVVDMRNDVAWWI
jgi:hypothetical protein